jgi:hypothetical protein
MATFNLNVNGKTASEEVDPNALYKATEKRHYHQPFITDKASIMG